MKARVLFLCTGNSARSQMAEGLLRHYAGERFEVFSAGIDPKGLNPLAVRAMAELGIDISNHISKSVKDFIGQPFEYVVTVCDSAQQKCPVFPAIFKYLHWSLEDPAEASGSEEERLSIFRTVRDEILSRIKNEFHLSAAA